MRIIDRASGPLRGMRREADMTELRFRRLGLTMDRLATRQQLSRMTAYRGELGRTDTQSKRLHATMAVLQADFRTFGEMYRIIRIPVMIAGFGALAQAVGAVGGSVIGLVGPLAQAVTSLVGLLPMLGQLAVGAGAVLPIFSGIGLAAVTMALSFRGLQQAWNGNAQALRRLTPEARQFLITIRQYSGEVRTLQASAQRGIFAGLDASIPRLQRALPVVNQLLANMGNRIGNLIRQATNRFTTPGFLQDILGIGQTGGVAVTRGGQSLINFADAMRQVAVAAEPFTRWLSASVLQWSKVFGAQLAVERETGQLQRRFGAAEQALRMFVRIGRDAWQVIRNIGQASSATGSGMWAGIQRTLARLRQWTGSVGGQASLQEWFVRGRQALEAFLRIGGNLLSFLNGLFRASSALGNSLVRSFENATASWAKFANSIGGQMRLRQVFNAIEAPLRQIFGLVKDLASALFQIGASSGLASMIAQLRQALPMLVQVLEHVAHDFGPPVIALFVQLSRTLAFLTGLTGPLTLFIRALGSVLRFVNDLISRFHFFGTLITAVLLTYGVYQFSNAIRALTGEVGGLARGWLGVSATANEAAAAQARAIGAGMGGGAQFAGRAAGAAATATGAEAYLAARGITMPTVGGVMGRETAGGQMSMFPVGAYALNPRSNAGEYLPGSSGLMGGATRSFGLARVGGFLKANPALGALGLLGTGALASQFIPGIPQGARNVGSNVIGGALMGGGFASFLGPEAIVPGALLGAAAGELRSLVGLFHGTSGAQRYVKGIPTGLANTLSAHGGNYPTTIPQLQTQVYAVQNAIAMTTAHLHDSAAKAARALLPALQDELRVRQQTLAAMRQQQAAEARIAAQRRAVASNLTARRSLADLGRAFTVMAGARGGRAGLQTVLAGAGRVAPGLDAASRRFYLEQLLGWAGNFDRAYGTRAGGQGVMGLIERTYSQLHQHVQVVNGRILDGSKRQWAQIRTVLGTEAERARETVTKSFTAIQQQAVGALVAMGWTRQLAATFIREAEQFGPAFLGSVGAPTAAAPHPAARPSPAARAAHPATRGAHPAHRSSGPRNPFGNPTGWQQFMPGSGGPGGGGAVPFHGHPGGLQPGIMNVANATLGQWPLTVTATTDGRHAAGSYHYKGEAVDLAADPITMYNAAAWIARMYGGQLVEGIHNPNLSIKNGKPVPPTFWGASTWAGHRDHIHLAVAGGAAAPGAAAAPSGAGVATLLPNATPGMAQGVAQLLPNAPQPSTGPMGVPLGLAGVVAQTGRSPYSLAAALASSSAVTTGMSAVASSAPTSAGTSMLAGGASAGSARAMGRAMLGRYGWGQDQWAPLNSLWTRESGWNPYAVNPTSGAAGIPQALGHGHVFALGDVAAQLAWGMNYVAGRYGSPAAAWAHEQAFNWYGDGGSGTAMGPTVIGLGEKGPEDFVVRPHRKGGLTSSGGIQITIGTILNNRPGDIRRQVQAELARAVRAIERQGVNDDSEVLR